MINEVTLVLAMLAVLLGITGCYQYGTQSTASFTISGKERVVSGDSSYYLIFTEEGETFANDDAFFHFKFDSSDLYGRLREGMQCEVHAYGWRIPFFSMYRNIVTANCRE